MSAAYLELGGHATVAGGDTKEDSVVFSQGGRGSDGVVGFGRGMDESENLLGEGLRDSGRNKQ